MGELWRGIVEFAQFLWPLAIVEQWERGGYYFFGRYIKDVGPGLWPVLPWFSKIIPVSVVPAIITTTRVDVSIRGGGTLSFIASAEVQVENVNAALNEVDSYQETLVELVTSVLADRLARLDPSRLQPENRNLLSRQLANYADSHSKRFGVRIRKIRFPSFVLNTRMYRLLGEAQTQLGASW